MSVDTSKFTLEEMLADRSESLKDIAICQAALDAGVTNYSGGSVQSRLNTNRRIIGLIDDELKRRGVAIPQESCEMVVVIEVR